jgi:membrane protein
MTPPRARDESSSEEPEARVSAGVVAARAIAAVFRIVVTALRRLGQERGPEAAASMSFYAVFSLFPLLLLLIAVGSRVLETPDAQERLLGVVLHFLPVSRELVRQNVLAVVRVRGAVGGIGVVSLLWAATSAFSTMVRNLNRAWPNARLRNLLGERLLALAMVVSLVALVLVYLLGRALVVLPEDWVFAERVAQTVRTIVPSETALSGFIFVILTALYLWLPRTKVLLREAAVGGAACALALRAATSLFTRFLSSGLMRYNLVYGSLGTLLALLSWVYVASLLVLGGAHLAAAVAAHTRGLGTAGEESEVGGGRAGTRSRVSTTPTEAE